ncbi:MAG: nucleotidyltransferase domain-containing protein [Candidatus Woesebacteria bacterium]|nr:nucleotidyltransferase domain-containing protein [Candidatus Woesebacteria bacterium]
MELKSNNFSSLRYHDLFDYKLTKEELVKWQYKNYKETTNGVKNKNRLQREKYSQAKLLLATKAAEIISKIPTVKFIGITGALAMNNANKDSDVDLMIITKSGLLWTTRLFVYLLICLFGIQTRKPRVKNERDALCLNMWMDEADLIWDKKDRNIYTAHEIAQIVPLVNKSNAYEKFLRCNRWILNYWPRAVKILRYKDIKLKVKTQKNFITFFEILAFNLQYQYMKSKITREIVTPTRAIFHPNDWGKIVLDKLSS